MAAVGLWLLGFGRGLMGWLSRRSLAEIAVILLSLTCVVELIGIRASHRENAKLLVQISKCTEARLADRKAYEAAQAEATRANVAQVQKIEAQHDKITNDVAARYREQLDRLRREAASGSAGKPGVPQASPAPGGPNGQTLPFSAQEILLAQECELQLNSLIDWNRQQAEVDPNAAH